MSIFAKHIATRSRKIEGAVESLTATTDAAASTDPLAGAVQDDEFAEQRARRNADLGITATESLSQETTQEVSQKDPVDGKDEDMTVGAVDTDVKLPTGKFGEDVDTTKSGNDIKVDADTTETKFTSEVDEDDFDRYEGEDIEIQKLEDQMRMLSDTFVAIEKYGVNPPVIAVMQTTGLLNSTALQSVGLESFSFDAPGGAESEMALEALGEKLKETSAAWAAKILSVAKDSGSKVMSVLNPLWDKVHGTVKKLSGSAWDAAKAGAATVKAHPYKTALAVIAAIALVGGVVMFCVTGMPAAGGGTVAMKAFLAKAQENIAKIKMPGINIKAAMNSAGEKIVITTTKAALVAEQGAISALGWSKASVGAMGSQLDRAWNGVKHGWTAMGDKGAKVAAGAGKAAMSGINEVAKAGSAFSADAAKGASKAASAAGASAKVSNFAGMVGAGVASRVYYSAVVSLILGLFRLTRAVVIGGLRMISSTLSAISTHTGLATA